MNISHGGVVQIQQSTAAIQMSHIHGECLNHNVYKSQELHVAHISVQIACKMGGRSIYTLLPCLPLCYLNKSLILYFQGATE